MAVFPQKTMAAMAATKTASPFPFCCSRPILLSVIILQWIVITFLLSQVTHRQATTSVTASTMTTSTAACTTQTQKTDILSGSMTKEVDRRTTSSSQEQEQQQVAAPTHLPGVGVTVLFRNPQWFHLRTTHMLHNAILNLPPGWGLQIFINPSWFFGDAQVLAWHPGLRRLLSGNNNNNDTLSSSQQQAVAAAQYRGTFLGRPIYVSWLPEHLTKRPAKPKGVLHNTWFWQSIIAERILIFSGNGVFCGNHALAATGNDDSSAWQASTASQPTTIWQTWGWTEPLPQSTTPYLDYLGSPSRMNDGMGGDGSSHSYRNRTSMLRLLEYAGTGDTSWQGPAEHTWVLKTMHRYNTEATNAPNFHPFYIATPEQTQDFGGVLRIVSDKHDNKNNKATTLHHVPYVAAGTFPNLAWEERETLLRHCPELKTIFPSLHEPTCFGAHPKPETCRTSICALRGDLPSSGC